MFSQFYDLDESLIHNTDSFSYHRKVHLKLTQIFCLQEESKQEVTMTLKADGLLTLN